MRFGFEREYFLCNILGEYVAVPPELPKDECGYLVEARGEDSSDPLKAAFLLLAEEHKLRQQAETLGLTLAHVDFAKLSPAFRQQMLRTHGKPQYPAFRGNIYGKDYRPTDTLARAGVHVHFSDTEKIETCVYKWDSGTFKKSDTTMVSRPRFIDYATIIQKLDKRFRKQILAARRLPGSYEMGKFHGGFEYRSLPATINVIEVAVVLAEIKPWENVV